MAPAEGCCPPAVGGVGALGHAMLVEQPPLHQSLYSVPEAAVASPRKLAGIK